MAHLRRQLHSAPANYCHLRIRDDEATTTGFSKKYNLFMFACWQLTKVWPTCHQFSDPKKDDKCFKDS